MARKPKCENQVTPPYFDWLSERCQPLWSPQSLLPLSQEWLLPDKHFNEMSLSLLLSFIIETHFQNICPLFYQSMLFLPKIVTAWGASAPRTSFYWFDILVLLLSTVTISSLAPLRLHPAPHPQSLATTSWLNGLRQCRLPPLLLQGWPAGIAPVAVWQRFQRNGPGRGRSSRTWRRWHRTLAMETIASMRWSSSSSCPLFYHWALLQCTWPQQQRRCRGEDYTPVIQLNDCLTNEIELTMKSMMLLARIMSITEGGSSSTWILVSAITAMKANQMENGTHFVTK